MATRAADIFGQPSGPLAPQLPAAIAPQPTGMGAIAPTAIPTGMSPAPVTPLSYIRDAMLQGEDDKPVEERVISKLKPGSDLCRATVDKLDAKRRFGSSPAGTRWSMASARRRMAGKSGQGKPFAGLLDSARQPPRPLSPVMC
jgi:hypothetical protein